jgi:phosphohistidine phosphatase
MSDGAPAVVLMRHGEALPTFAHPERPLTRHGRAEVAVAGRYIAERFPEVSEIRHSRLLRARQTAEIVAQELAVSGPGRPPLCEAALDPAADPVAIAEDLALDPRPVVLVGHIPLLDRLVHHLAGEAVCQEPETFGTSMAMCLFRNDTTWRMEWVFAPERNVRR